MRMRLLLTLIITGHFALVALAIAAPAKSALQSIDLPKSAGPWAVSSATGGVAVIESATNQVALFPSISSDGTFDGARRQPVGAQPVSITHKPMEDGGFFIVACKGDRTIHVLDEKTLKPAKVFKLSTNGAARFVAAASDPASPLVYFALTRGDSTQVNGTIGRLDLSKMVVEGPMEMAAHDEFEVTPSADGSIFYLRKATSTPAGFEAWRVLPPASEKRASRAIPIFGEHTEKARYVPDAIGHTVATGKFLYSANLQTQIAELPAEVVCFLRTQPVIIGVKKNALIAMSSNDHRIIGKPVELPDLAPEAEEAAARRQHGLADPLWEVHVDEKNENLVAREHRRGREGDKYGDSIVVIPLSAMELPDEPFLFADAPNGAELTVGEPWEAKVTKRSDAASLELASGPEGMTRDGDTLKWTPTQEQVGVVTGSLRMAAKDIERLQPFNVTVRQRHVALPFAPHEMLVSPDGKRIVVLHPSSFDLTKRMGAEEDRATRVVLVDTASGRVLADRIIPFDVGVSRDQNMKSAAIDDEQVYLPAMSADAFYALSLKDLSDVKRVFLPGRPHGMRVAGDKLFVTIRDKPIQMYTIPSLNLEPVPQSPLNAQVSQEANAAPQPAGTGWFYRGVLYDAAMSEPLLLAQSWEFPSFPMSQEQNELRSREGGLTPSTWDIRRVNANTLQRASGQNIGNVTGRDIEILGVAPAAAALVMPDGAGRQIRADIVIHDLVTASPVATIPLIDEPRDAAAYGSPGNSGESPPMLEQAGEGSLLVALVSDKIFLLPTAPFKTLELPEPLWIEPKQSAFAASPGRPSTFTYKAHGGTAPLVYALVGATEGVSIDSQSGVVTVDSSKMINQAGDVLRGWVQDRHRYDQTAGKQRSPDEMVDAYRTVSGEAFAQLTGQTPSGLPIALPIVVSVSDAEQQQTQLAHLILLDIDPTMVGAKLGAPGAIRRAPVAREGGARRQKKVDAQDASPPAVEIEATPAPKSTDDIAALKRRIAELEKENAELRKKQ